MKILIRTLPLRRGNYGGILQAWALQQALKDLGADPFTDRSDRPAKLVPYTARAVARPVRNLLPSGLNILPGDARWRGDARVRGFVHEEVATTSLFPPYTRRPRTRVLKEFDAFVVGSDQVWRSAYGDVPSYLLDFLPEGDGRRKVAYAASFGSTEANAWSPQMVTTASELMGRFDGLSCREESGTRWIREHLGLDADTMPDPTLLLAPERYEQLIRRTGASRGTPAGRYVLAYVLDRSPEFSRVIQGVADEMGAEVLEIGNADGKGGAGTRPSPAEWLNLIANAQLMVTDSFHGMLFAGVLNTPHAGIPNQSRGVDRFHSLADLLATRGAIATDAAEVAAIAGDFGGRVDRATTEQRLDDARAAGLGFLRHSLSL